MIHLVYFENRRKMARPIQSRVELMLLRDAPERLSNLTKARQGDSKAKGRLLQLAYNIGYANGPLAGCKSIGSQFFLDVDCYDVERSEAIKKQIMEQKEAIGLLMLERSVNGGWHLICRRQQGTTILENQVRVASMLHLEMDTNTKDLQRVAYATSASEEDLVYLDDAIFTEPMTPEECEREYTYLLARQRNGEEQVPKSAKKANKHYINDDDNGASHPKKTSSATNGDDDKKEQPVSDSTVNEKGNEKRQFPTEYKGIPYTEIINKYWELNNDGKEPMKGDRDTLTYQLAYDLRHICGRDADWLDQVIPCYDGFSPEEKRKKIASAMNAKMESMPYRLRIVLQALKATKSMTACGGTITTPPPLPQKLPPLIEHLTKNVPDIYKPAVASAVFPSLGAHMHGVKFRYWDNVEHEPTIMNVLIGRQSIGKGCIKKPIEYIMDDIRQRDIPNRLREAEWKQKNPGAKQKKDPRPNDICIQILIDNMTDAVFNQRIVDAHNNGQRFVYSIVDEIDALKKVTSRGTADEVGLLIRKAYDNSMGGQDRVGSDSVTGIAPIRWNFNASTTPPNARRFFNKMLNDGTVSRLDISTIIINEGNEDNAPIMGIYDQQYATDLKPYIDRLEAAYGEIECPEAKDLALQMRQDNNDAARLYDSEAYRIFSYRANVIAWLKGMVLYVAHGYKWDDTIAEFVRWSQQYNLWCKMLYFGQQMEQELNEELQIQRQSGPQNLLSLLPDVFNREQYSLMRQQQGRSNDGGSALRNWINRGYVTRDEKTNQYIKTEEYRKRVLSYGL